MFATQKTTLLFTAPISATNSIEDRHKEGTALKHLSPWGCCYTCSILVPFHDLRTHGDELEKRSPYPFLVVFKKGTLNLICYGRYVKSVSYTNKKCEINLFWTATISGFSLLRTIHNCFPQEWASLKPN